MGDPAEKQYLGDGVYVTQENGMLLLTTENGISVTNRIYLEPKVLSMLLWYAGPLLGGEFTFTKKTP